MTGTPETYVYFIYIFLFFFLIIVFTFQLQTLLGLQSHFRDNWAQITSDLTWLVAKTGPEFYRGQLEGGFYAQRSSPGQAVVNGVAPSPPARGYVPSVFVAHGVQHSHCLSIFIEYS